MKHTITYDTDTHRLVPVESAQQFPEVNDATSGKQTVAGSRIPYPREVYVPKELGAHHRPGSMDFKNVKSKGLST
mgnify:CR=1 FL=1